MTVASGSFYETLHKKGRTRSKVNGGRSELIFALKKDKNFSEMLWGTIDIIMSPLEIND